MTTTDGSYQGHNLIFVVGCPRSGTTWLQRLLASHPSIDTGQESHLFDWYIGPQLRAWRKSVASEERSRRVGLACYFREEEFIDILRSYMVALLEPMVCNVGPDQWFLEKSPSHALFLPEIHALLPQSRFIHILRDARDVVSSMLAASQSWGAHWAPGNAYSAARLWVRHVKAVRDATREIPCSHLLEVQYESLSNAPADVLARISGFLGVQWTAADIEKAIQANQPGKMKTGAGTQIPLGGKFETESGGVVNEPPEFVRKARPGTWTDDLTFTQKAVVWGVARRTMREVGYSWR